MMWALQRRRGGSAWTPASAAGLVGWYEFDAGNLFQNSDGTTAVTTNDDPVGYCADLGGAGNHIIQATTDNRPLFKTGGFVAGADAGDFLAKNPIATTWDYATAGYTIGIKFNDPTVGTGDKPLQVGRIIGNVGVSFKRSFNNLGAEWYDGTNSYDASISNFFTQSTNTAVIAYSDYGNNQIFIENESGAVSAAAATRLSTTLDRISVCSRFGTSSTTYLIKAVVVYNTPIDATARASLIAYLAAL